MPGNYQGWDSAITATIITSPLNDGVYEGYFWFKEGVHMVDYSIPEDGNYTIDLILNQPRYTYTITKN